MAVLARFFEESEALAEVDDVDSVALRKNVALHLRVPTTSLVSEVYACVEQFLNTDSCF